MKTGIIRRVDDLGRVVIPKEIRNQLKIKVGDPLEIGIVDGKVVFSKYKEVNDYATMLQILKAFFGEGNVHLYFNDTDIPISEKNAFLVDCYAWITVTSEQFSDEFIKRKVDAIIKITKD